MVSKDCQNLNNFFNNVLNENCCDESNDSIKISCNNDSITSLEINGYSGYLKFDKFPILKEIKSIKINKVKIENLPEIFFKLPNLSELSVTNATLKYITLNNYNNEILSKLDLSGNDLNEIPISISSLYGLQKLILNKNPNLINLNLNNICNKLISYDVCDKLISLDLSETGINSIPNDIMELRNLESLNISKNSNLTNINDSLFYLEKLKYFDISDNPKLHAKIINFGSKIDQCKFNNTNIDCYQEGTCSSIDQNIRYDNCSSEYISNVRNNNPNNNNNSYKPSLLFPLFLITVFIPPILVYFVCDMRKRNNGNLYTHRNHSNSSILPTYTEYANSSEVVVAMGDNIPMNTLTNNNNNNNNNSDNNGNNNNDNNIENLSEIDIQELPPSYIEAIRESSNQD